MKVFLCADGWEVKRRSSTLRKEREGARADLLIRFLPSTFHMLVFLRPSQRSLTSHLRRSLTSSTSPKPTSVVVELRRRGFVQELTRSARSFPLPSLPSALADSRPSSSPRSVKTSSRGRSTPPLSTSVSTPQHALSTLETSSLFSLSFIFRIMDIKPSPWYASRPLRSLRTSSVTYL